MVQVGNTVTLLSIIDPVDATNTDVTWTTSDASIATVVSGVVTGVDLGVVTITATSAENSLYTAECEVTVDYGVSGDITEDTRWYAQATYLLSGFVYVKNDAVLTIEPGTLIKGISNTKATLIGFGKLAINLNALHIVR